MHSTARASGAPAAAAGRVRARRAAALNLLFPGAGYALLGRRPVLAGLLLAYTLATATLGALHVLTLRTHWAHLHPEAFPGVGAQVMLFAAQHAFIAGGVAWDAWREALAGPAPQR